MKAYAVILLGHGSVSDDCYKQFFKFIEESKHMFNNHLYGAFLELASPSIYQTVEEISDKYEKIIIIPFMLFGATHSKSNIPASIIHLRTIYKNIEFIYGKAIGINRDLLDIISSHINQKLITSVQNTNVLIIGRGSNDPDANGDLIKFSYLLQTLYKYKLVFPSFVSLAEPEIITSLKQFKLFNVDHIIVVLYYLFDGVLPERSMKISKTFGMENNIEINIVHPILRIYDSRISAILKYEVDNLLNTINSTNYVNCDFCIYREKIKGYESEYKRSPWEHYHPDHNHTH